MPTMAMTAKLLAVLTEITKMMVLGAHVRNVVTLSLRLTLRKSPFPTLTI
jgi:hypothetical protein